MSVKSDCSLINAKGSKIILRLSKILNSVNIEYFQHQKIIKHQRQQVIFKAAFKLPPITNDDQVTPTTYTYKHTSIIEL